MNNFSFCNLQSFIQFGGGNRIRTDDILLAKQALYQLSYTPKITYQTKSMNDSNDKFFQVMKRLKSALRAFFMIL